MTEKTPITDMDRLSLAWIEWWMHHHKCEQKLGGTLTAALAQLRDLLQRHGISTIPINASPEETARAAERARKGKGEGS